MNQLAAVKEEILCQEKIKSIKVPRKQSGAMALSRPGFSSSEDEMIVE